MSLIRKILTFAIPGFLLSCVQYKDELTRQYYENQSAAGKPAQVKKEDPAPAKQKLEDRAKKEFKQEDLDLVDEESLGFMRVRNPQGIRLTDWLSFNMLGYGGIKGAWQDSIEREHVGTAQLKGLFKVGDFRFATIFQDLYQVDKADPEDQEDIDLTANVSRLIGSLGAHFATSDKDFMVYVEPVKIGEEYTELSGPVDIWARDTLLGLSVGCASRSLDFLARASVMASAGRLGIEGVDKYKGRVGVDEISVEGEYERLFGSVHVMKGLGANLYLFAKAGADVKNARGCLETNTYLVSGGLQQRLKISQLPFAISASIYGKDRHKQFEGQERAIREIEYGAVLRAQLDLLKGWYLEAYAQFAPQYDHGFKGHFFRDGELEGGVSVVGVLGDMFGSDEKKE